MAYLHENKEEFANAVNLASEYFRVLPIIVEILQLIPSYHKGK